MSPDGVDYDNKIEYIEVVSPERIVYFHGGGEEEERKRFVEEYESMKQGFGGTFDQLDDYLAIAV
ncbi:hypothetical protein KW850_27355 [Bacillus sp. sid0103]|uniref:hypothetical protein n=1 Tax=Bacillus sp. sid0103 TaxID=2856337 RepID=UPI001C47F3A0|nr:hypothetical protein [Bacillus sp. sid0103]MBV7508924.1 hypothetical protein [Bacillus sp. sid0103]